MSDAKRRKRGAERKTEQVPPAEPVPDTAGEKAFVEALIVSGQAAPLGADGRLPPGATHELIVNEDGERTVVRRRFSSY